MKKLIAIVSLASFIYLFGCTSKSKESQSPEKKPAAETKKSKNAAVIMPQSAPDTLKGSLVAEATGKVGETEITISYHSPAVRGRIVWEGLVPYDIVWVTGAHMATSIEFNHDLVIASKTIAAGKYAFFTIPGKNEWTIILNKNWQQHLTDKYDAKDDVVRVNVKPEIEETHQERLRFVIEAETNSSGEIVMYWDKLEISLPIEVVN